MKIVHFFSLLSVSRQESGAQHSGDEKMFLVTVGELVCTRKLAHAIFGRFANGKCTSDIYLHLSHEDEDASFVGTRLLPTPSTSADCIEYI